MESDCGVQGDRVQFHLQVWVTCTFTYIVLVILHLLFPTSPVRFILCPFLGCTGLQAAAPSLPGRDVSPQTTAPAGWPLICGFSSPQAPVTLLSSLSPSGPQWQWLRSISSNGQPLPLVRSPDPALWIVLPYCSSEAHLSGSLHPTRTQWDMNHIPKSSLDVHTEEPRRFVSLETEQSGLKWPSTRIGASERGTD